MRLVPLSVCAALGALLALPACAPEPEAGPAALPSEARTASSGAAFTVSVDSLLRDEPALAYRVAVGYPQLRGMAGEPLSPTVRAVNAAIADSAGALADDFRPEPPPPGAGPPATPVEVDGATTRTFVSDDAFSALVEVYAYTGGAHGTTIFLPLTFDLRTGEAVAAADLFADGTPWADTLAAYVERGARLQIAEAFSLDGPEAAREHFYADGLDAIREGRVDVTLQADGVAVHVPPYQLSAYAAGPFQVLVPLDAVAPFARPGGLLARVAGR